MYQLTKVKPQELTKVKVQNQDKIVELTGRRLEPTKAYEVIKNETKGFTVDSDKAKQADKLFTELLKKNGIQVNGTATEPDNRLRLQAQAKAKALELLELELELAA